MRTELNSPLGFYTPTFFRVQLNSDYTIENIKDLPADVSAALFHEYIHYLQDITTIYGLMNINYVVDFMKTVNLNQIKCTDRNFKIPYVLTAEKDDIVFYNSILRIHYNGSFKNLSVKSVDSFETYLEKLEVPIFGGGLTEKNVNCYKLICRDVANIKFEYTFGSHSIIESMAFELELATHGNVLQSPSDLPYRGARYVADFYFRDLVTTA